jgi:hypothetical protein
MSPIQQAKRVNSNQAHVKAESHGEDTTEGQKKTRPIQGGLKRKSYVLKASNKGQYSWQWTKQGCDVC